VHVTVTVQPNATGQVRNTVVVTAADGCLDNPGAQPTSCQASDTDTVLTPDSTVTPSHTTAPTEKLAQTGANILGAAALSMLLLGVGGAFVVRRRQHARATR
jgi:LPXTG-motif cell wall-anchored protein